MRESRALRPASLRPDAVPPAGAGPTRSPDLAVVGSERGGERGDGDEQRDADGELEQHGDSRRGRGVSGRSEQRVSRGYQIFPWSGPRVAASMAIAARAGIRMASLSSMKRLLEKCD